MFLLDDTIAALASAAGPGGRGIIRCSGPQVVEVLNRRFVPRNQAAWTASSTAARHSGLWELQTTGRQVPVDLYLWPNRRSYTGQPQAELHTIGSPPILEAMLGDLFEAGVRPAQAGEFTLRAFLAGRVDLLQAEAVLGVIDAADHVELQTALAQLAGGISHRLTELRVEFLDLLADLEAGLDFTEEGLEFVSREVLVERVISARNELQRLLASTETRTRHAARSRVVIAGPPNAGKSTLFNALVGRSAALVSPIAGTTRDYLTAEVDWHGAAVELVDTAGLEETSDAILQVALQLRAGQIKQADLILHCTAADDTNARQEIAIFDAHQLQVDRSSSPQSLQVITKSDTANTSDWPRNSARIMISALTGQNLNVLKSKVAELLSAEQEGETHILGSSAARCRDSLEHAIAALSRAADLAAEGGGDEFLATDVREALDELGRITGALYTDDLLDRIFSKFCIGK
ncbi:MAG: tRNA uridine-5-carboxymethylaminomethyl(34) synthesis GTPase MnmE [Planctomycetota bacterium]